MLLDQVGRYVWSPDSTQVAYLAPLEERGLNGALEVLDIASGKIRQVVSLDFLGSDYSPQWLPTGEIVFVRDGQLWSIQADGKKEKRLPGLKFFSRLPEEEKKTPYPDDPNAWVGYHFSPNGKQVAYMTRSRTERTISRRLWLANADGSNAILITEQAAKSYYEWSPDSQWLVFDTFRDVDDPKMLERDLEGFRKLWVVHADGSNVHLLFQTKGWREILSPTWSPDSRLIAFIQVGQPAEDGIDDTDLWVINVTEPEEKALLLDSSGDEAMFHTIWWSPDGNYLYTFADVPGNRKPYGQWGRMPGYVYESQRLTLATK